MTTMTAPTMSLTTTRPKVGRVRKLLIPLVLVVAVVALIVVTKVPWTGDAGASGVSLKADDGRGATLSVSNLEPGDSVSKSVTIRNSSTGDSRLSFEESAPASDFASGELRLRIVQDGRTVYDGRFGAMNDVAQDVGNLSPGGSSTFTFTVSLPQSAPYAHQGSPAVAAYSWVSTTTGS